MALVSSLQIGNSQRYGIFPAIDYDFVEPSGVRVGGYAIDLGTLVAGEFTEIEGYAGKTVHFQFLDDALAAGSEGYTAAMQYMALAPRRKGNSRKPTSGIQERF